ncbi:MAG TPA: ABC transporter ATP-binding protein [Phycisphaerae bacterium]|nr:ABC transporter ATP-binding protein [Phycisphaerae bacterium]
MAVEQDGLVIDLRDIAKVYRRKVHALKGIEMQVGRGEVFGLLGPNGAGKTTLVKIMMTIVRPTRGAGTMLGRPIGHKRTLRRVGYLPEDVRFPAYLTGRRALDYYAALSRADRRTRRRRIPELLELVGLAEWGRARIGTYSKGMVQRLGLAQALMHDPQLVLLDEPTDGLDPMGRRGVRELLTRLRDEGKTVFLNSHLLSEAEMVCDRVAILNDGKVVRQGRLAELTRKRLLYEIEVEGADPAGALDAVRGALPAGADRKVALNGGVLRVEGVDAAGIQPAIDALRARKIVIRSLRAERQSLEDLFIETVTAPPPAPPAAQKGGAR